MARRTDESGIEIASPKARSPLLRQPQSPDGSGGWVDDEARAWTYDVNGNRTSYTSTSSAGGSVVATDVEHDAQDRLLRWGDTCYSYDARGSLLETRLVDGGDNCTANGGLERSYDYDVLGRLHSVAFGSGETVTYTYDPRGRRIVREHVHPTDPTTTTRFLYGRGLLPIAKLGENHQVLQRYVYAESGHVPSLIADEVSGSVYRVVTDHLGSVRAVVDVDTGAVVQEIEYDTWGQVTSDTNPGFQPFGYAGGLYDPATGLVRFGARDYDPAVGRWTAKDPIGFKGGDGNLYVYVSSNPHRLVDPSGLLVWGTYDKSSGEVTLTDLSSGESVRYGAESGGQPFGDPLPDGHYDILERQGRKDFYRLDPLDQVPRDDRHDKTGRHGFRLHGPGRTVGCIAAKDADAWRPHDPTHLMSGLASGRRV